MDPDIEAIWREAQLENEVIHQVGENFQRLVEQAIGNVAALRTLDDGGIEDAVKNS